jgi:hypothetical protein
MLSIGLWRRYSNITNTVLDIIHRSVFYWNHDVSKTGFCLRLQVESIELGPIYKGSFYLRWCPKIGYVYVLGPTEYVSTEDGDRIQSPKRNVLNKRQDDG